MYPDFYVYVENAIKEGLDVFPYIMIIDPHQIIDEKFLAGLKINMVAYKNQSDYSLVRLQGEQAKVFRLEPTLFVFQNDPSKIHLSDLSSWFNSIDVDEKIIEFCSKRFFNGQEVPKPIIPLAALVIKQNLLDKLEELSKKTKLEELNMTFLTELFLSTLLDEDIIAKNGTKKVSKLFRVIFVPEKYQRAKLLLDDKEIQEFVEATFSVNKMIQTCLSKPDFRERICVVVLGMYCLRNFSERKREALISILSERFGFRSKEEKEELSGLFNQLEKELGLLSRDFVEEKFILGLNDFIKDNEKLWFEDVNLEKAPQLLSGLLPFEFEWIDNQTKEAVKQLPRGVGKLREITMSIKSWPIATKEELKERIDELVILISLMEIYNLFPRTILESWEEWCNLYENVILKGDHLMSEEIGRPSLRRDETWKVLSSTYRKKRDEFVSGYEDFLKTNYLQWIEGEFSKPIIVSDLIEYYLKGLVKKYETVFLLVFDGMRLDFWNVLKDKLTECFKVIDETRICSLIPSSTPISRYGIFSGRIPKYFEKVDESAALQKALPNIQCGRILEGRTAHSFLDLEKATEKVRSFIFYTTELHKEERSLATALKRFEASLPEIVNNIKDIISKARDSVVIITSDHGSCEASEPLELRPSQYEESFHIEPESRCWIVGEKVAFRERRPIFMERIPERKLRDFRQHMSSILKQKAFIFEPEELRLVRSDGTIRYRGEIHRPFLVLIARKNCSLQREMPFAHGGLTPYETIVPFAVLVPK